MKATGSKASFRATRCVPQQPVQFWRQIDALTYRDLARACSLFVGSNHQPDAAGGRHKYAVHVQKPGGKSHGLARSPVVTEDVVDLQPDGILGLGCPKIQDGQLGHIDGVQPIRRFEHLLGRRRGCVGGALDFDHAGPGRISQIDGREQQRWIPSATEPARAFARQCQAKAACADVGAAFTDGCLRRWLDRPQELLLAELGRASRMFPGLAPSLRTAHPCELALDADGAYRLLSGTAAVLDEAGFGVLLPSWWDRRRKLGLALSAHTPVDGVSTEW
jgi:hypothetical protein